MLRTLLVLASITGLLCLSAFRLGDPFSDRNPLIYNTTIAHFFDHEARLMPFAIERESVVEIDTNSRPHILMLDYSAYGSAYNDKIRGILSKYMPKATFTDFKEGTADDLARVLVGCEAVVIAYPSSAIGMVKTYSKVLGQYVQQGGAVLLTGTHEFEVLQQFGLFDLDFGYFSKDRAFHALQASHPIFNGVPADFSLSNFAYPLDISDPGFVTIADVGGYPVMGYKPCGTGKVIYIGVEYYFDEPVSSRILANAVAWAGNEQAATTITTGVSTEAFRFSALKRSEEMLFAGNGAKEEQIDLKIYPNPYFNKATLDIELVKPTALKIEMTDEVGRSVALVLPKKTIGPGLCRFELPNIAPGIYFLQIQLGEKNYVRKVVKSASN